MEPARSSTRYRLAGLATVGVFALAGCSASTSGDAATDAEPTALTIAAQSGPNSLDPAQLSNGQQMFVWTSVLDTLLARDPATGDIVPNAAEAWEYNDDGTVLTLTLREGMTFSDDTPVDAEAVAATMNRTRETPGQVQPKFSQVTDVAATGDLEVEVRFDRFDPQFVPNLAYGVGAIGHPDTLDDERTATDPIGSGPYTLSVENSVDGSTYVLEKRDDYWNADAIEADTFTVQVMQDPTAAFNALQSGEVDAAGVQAQMLSQLPESGFTFSTTDATGVMLLDLIGRGGDGWPALQDERVRQAINYAFDRESIVDSLLGGGGMPSAQVFNPDGDVYDASLDEMYPYDPDRGRELVEEAGFAGATFEIPSTYLSTAFEPTISQAFEDVGLNVEWKSIPPQQVQSAVQSGDYGIVFQVSGFSSDPEEAFSRYAIGGYGNPLGYTDPTLDSLFETINSTVAFEEAVPTYQELNAYAMEQALVVPIAYTGTTWAAHDGITASTVGGLPPTISTFDLGG
ncbi:ABC transporter substrate-binding protein [Microbacterium halophytorum]|uniref:ABC transporter substrate-binding protein n=1 Tax=Microbacterium halophytorum TaxID=2067568 RepID=UPI000CFB55A2|nr:ABC transporter substrate-binding protein [Microbacterium halophytorum]